MLNEQYPVNSMTKHPEIVTHFVIVSTAILPALSAIYYTLLSHMLIANIPFSFMYNHMDVYHYHTF